VTREIEEMKTELDEKMARMAQMKIRLLELK
jgi:hypothetical protein